MDKSLYYEYVVFAFSSSTITLVDPKYMVSFHLSDGIPILL